MQIKSGTVSVTNGSPTVTGTNTTWLNRANAGDSFIVAGVPVFYTTASVDSNTQLTLSVAYAGTTQSDVSYAINQDFTPLTGLPEITTGDIEVAATFTRAMRQIDQQLSTAQDAGAITAAGVYPDTSSGIAGTTSGEYFFVPETDEFVLYLNSSGTAAEQLRFASLATALQYAQDAAQAATDAQNAADSAEQSLSDAQALQTDYEDVLTAAQQAQSSAEGSAAASEQYAASSASSATEAGQDADRAEAAADVATLSNAIYPDTATGIAEVEDGEYFSTPSADGDVYLELYRNNAGTADLIATYPTQQGLQSVVGTIVHLTTSTTYTMPTNVPDQSRFAFTKTGGVVPIIEAGTGQTIEVVGQSMADIEYDIQQELVLVLNGSVWEVLNV